MNTGGTKKSKEQNVYIASLPRSGSTLLGMVLNQGEKSGYIGESFYWGKLNPKKETCVCKVFGCKTLSAIYEEVVNNNSILKISDVLPALDGILQKGDIPIKYIEKKLKHDIDRSCVGFGEEANIFRRRLNKNIIINSSSNIVIAERLARDFNWKVIVLIRDPRGVIFSMKNAAIRHETEIPKDLWVNYIINFIKRAELLCKYKNVLTVRYEDICRNPKKEIKRVCNFLQIDFQDNMLQYKQNRGHFLMANRMCFDDNEIICEDNRWIKFLSDDEKNIISNNKILVNYYQGFGYRFNC